jgi:hypothetical protein
MLYLNHQRGTTPSVEGVIEMKQLDKFMMMVEALGVIPTQEQSDRLESWMIHNIPRTQWADAAINAIHIGDIYTNMRERMSECGVY